MRTKAAVALLSAVVASSLAACGGGSKTATPPGKTKTGGGGGVTARPTVGKLGPSEIVTPGGSTVTGKAGPMSPTATQPGPAEQHAVGGGVACASTTASPSGSNLSTMSAAILCLLNAERAQKGMTPLHLNARLTTASARMARLMVQKRFFAHDTPDGHSLLDRVKPTGYVTGRWQLGENLAWGNGGLDTPRAIVNSWMHSKGHKANILHAAFHDIGIGITLGPPDPSVSGGTTYVTDFGRHG